MQDQIQALIQRFMHYHGYTPDLVTPRTFSEKLQWIKLHGQLERFAPYADKYEVREYVARTIGEPHLIPLIGVYERTQDVDLDSLPSAFIMKATHGSGWNRIVHDKQTVDWADTCAQLDQWLATSFGEQSGEACYTPIRGRVVIEELITDPLGDLKDYKLFCFHGKVRMIQVDAERYGDHKRNLYDAEWTQLPARLRFDNITEPVEKPAQLDELIAIAERLAEPFPFVRVDLYYTSGRIYFGELTFAPGNGFLKFEPFAYDQLLGEWLDLSKCQIHHT
ncbi:ATP-grasp fold amidoligase family protein [Paenibacillus sp. YYML68]|uniref:ATP-grasp fold amidoligase family protein n=1 Tax=Paenibacillus sp. YYML68 TaxID=2909250 RepID=UPI002490E8DC|nr:ATP-grasp fold amidoligase family protein [Paenibacillus sp. YYML68]